MTDWATLDAEYQETEVPETTVLPDGPYQATIVSSSVGETEWGDTQLELVFEADYPYGNETRTGRVTKWLTIDSARMADEKTRTMLLGMLKRDLQTLKYEGPPSQLENHAPGFEGAVVEITVKTKQGTEKTWRNVYLNQLVTEAPPRKEPVAATVAADDDIPF